jgi:acetolactate synthase-1/2/3 large subunit
MIGVTLPIVKHSYLVTDINDIPRIVKEAFYIAQSGRPGPVVIDFPKTSNKPRRSPSGRRSNRSRKVCAATISPT